MEQVKKTAREITKKPAEERLMDSDTDDDNDDDDPFIGPPIPIGNFSNFFTNKVLMLC